jgi:hypothetical protein
VKEVKKDFDKLKKVNAPNKFGLILGTHVHVHKESPKELKGIVKYDGNIRKVYERYKDANAIIEKASAVIRKLYGDRIACEDKVAAGSAFGLDVTMYYDSDAFLNTTSACSQGVPHSAVRPASRAVSGTGGDSAGRRPRGRAAGRRARQGQPWVSRGSVP